MVAALTPAPAKELPVQLVQQLMKMGSRGGSGERRFTYPWEDEEGPDWETEAIQLPRFRDDLQRTKGCLERFVGLSR